MEYLQIIGLPVLVGIIVAILLISYLVYDFEHTKKFANKRKDIIDVLHFFEKEQHRIEDEAGLRELRERVITYLKKEEYYIQSFELTLKFKFIVKYLNYKINSLQ